VSKAEELSYIDDLETTKGLTLDEYKFLRGTLEETKPECRNLNLGRVLYANAYKLLEEYGEWEKISCTTDASGQETEATWKFQTSSVEIEPSGFAMRELEFCLSTKGYDDHDAWWTALPEDEDIHIAICDAGGPFRFSELTLKSWGECSLQKSKYSRPIDKKEMLIFNKLLKILNEEFIKLELERQKNE